MENVSNEIQIPIIFEKEMEVKSFVMGFHEYRKIWIPKENDVLLARMESTNKNL